MTSQLNSLNSTHIADEIKKVDDNGKKKSFSNKTSLVHNRSVIDDLERAAQSFYGDQYYNNSWLAFKTDYHSFDFVNSRYINYWKSKGIFTANSSSKKPDIHLAGETVSVNFSANFLNNQKLIITKVQWHYIVYKLDNRRILSPD